MRGLLVILLLAACAPAEPRVGDARLIEADGVVEAPEGTTIEIGKTPIPRSLSGPVRLAADLAIPYRDVVAAVQAVRAAGGKPYLLVKRRNKIYALPEPTPSSGDAIRLSARADGKACVSPPDNDEATCVSRKDQPRIDRAFVRQIIGQAVRDWGLKHVRVSIDPELPWADAVRAIDGARTCCGEDSGVTISVEPS
jgi:hypothetical protein